MLVGYIHVRFIIVGSLLEGFQVAEKHTASESNANNALMLFPVVKSHTLTELSCKLFFKNFEPEQDLECIIESLFVLDLQERCGL